MSLLQTVDPAAAEGDVKEIYDALQANIGMIPTPMELASVSPWMMKYMWASIMFYTQHPNLGFGLLSTIRYLVAEAYDYQFCINFNKNFLLMQGMTEEDIQKTSQDPTQAPLDDKDRAMVSFVMTAIKKPDAVSQENVDSLKNMGWKDSDIIEALAHATNMIGASIMMKTFKMDITC